MQTYAETASQAVVEAEKSLRIALEQKETNYAVFEPLLARLRLSSQDHVFLTFATAAAKTTEDRLWDGHVRVNKKFQKHLKHFRDGSGKKKHVERRKAEKHYLNFIKSSQQFYRGYIQRLASQFNTIPELALISSKLRLDTLTAEPSVNITAEQKTALVASCHNALMRLGDLSRYRSTELELTDRNWGPAKGHYQLALYLKPESGAAYNQLAVMALADEDHLRAVYYLHRAAAAGKPFPVARDNVKLEFEKLLKFEPEEKPAVSDTSKQTLEVLENRFLAFHANCHRQPSEFLTFTEKATQILQLVTLGFEEIKDRSLDKLVQRMCLISIAAEYLAWQGTSKENLPSEKILATKADKKTDQKLLDEHQRSCQSYFLLQRFNILTFTALLKILNREVVDFMDESNAPTENLHSAMPASVRRLLPHLRQYSSWLLSNIKALLSPKHPSTQRCLDRFWSTYQTTANLLLDKYSIGQIQDVDHLLEEDEDTLAFAPFTDQVSGWRNNLGNGLRKPAFPSTDVASHPRPAEQESLARIQRFVFDGATIAHQKDALGLDWAPLALVDTIFVLNSKPIKAPEVIKPQTPPQPFRIRAHLHGNSLSGVSPASSPQPENHKLPIGVRRQPHDDVGDNSQALGPQAQAMENMVNELVSHKSTGQSTPIQAHSSSLAPQEPSVPMNPQPYSENPTVSSGTERSSSGPLNIMDIVRNMQQRPTELFDPVSKGPGPGSTRLSNLAFTGTYNAGFTPLAAKTASPTSRPGTASELASTAQLRSSAIFQQDILQREREIQMQTSPQVLSELSSWPMPYGGTPTILAPQAWDTSVRSPWSSPSARSPVQQSRQLPQTALFGAIGEPRRNGNRTPTSGNSG